MADVVYTLTQVGRANVVGNRKQKVFDLTADTGAYQDTGNTFTAADFGLKKIDFVNACGPVTGGTSGATINWLGFTYNSENTTVLIQQYECAATGLPGLQKTDNEATVANFNVRLTVQGR